MLDLQLVEQPALERAGELRFGGLDQVEAPGKVGPTGGADLVGSQEAIVRVLAHGLQQVETVGPGRHHQRLVHESRHQVEDGIAVERSVRQDLLGRLDGEASAEHGQSTEDELLRRFQEVVAPLDGRLQGLLACHCSPAPARQQPEPVVQTVGDCCWTHHADPRCGELDAQGEAIESSADPGDHLECPGIGIESGSEPGRPIDEQLDRRARRDGVRGRPVRRYGQRARLPVQFDAPMSGALIRWLSPDGCHSIAMTTTVSAPFGAS